LSKVSDRIAVVSKFIIVVFLKEGGLNILRGEDRHVEAEESKGTYESSAKVQVSRYFDINHRSIFNKYS